MSLKILAFLIVLLGIFAGGVGAEPVVQTQWNYSYMTDESVDAVCPEFLRLNVKNILTEVERTRDICAGGKVVYVVSSDGDVLMIDKKGGNAGGWGVYRYDVMQDKLELFDPKSSEIYLSQHDDKGVWLDVHRSHYGSNGRENDTIERWYWGFDKEKPIQK